MAGAMQRCGENFLATAKRLISVAPKSLAQISDTSYAEDDILMVHSSKQELSHIYFDVLGSFTVLYSTASARVINLLVLIGGLAYLYRTGYFSNGEVKQLGRFMVSILAAVLTPVAIAAVWVFILRRPMITFFANQVLAVGLYGAAVITSADRWKAEGSCIVVSRRVSRTFSLPTADSYGVLIRGFIQSRFILLVDNSDRMCTVWDGIELFSRFVHRMPWIGSCGRYNDRTSVVWRKSEIKIGG